MDEIKRQIEYSKMLASKVLGTLTEAEKETLRYWEQQEANKGVSNEILNAKSFSEWQAKYKGVDTAEEWATFLSRMEQNSKTSSQVIRLRAIKWMSAVAAVLIVGFAVFTFFNSNNNLKSIDASSIAPGTSHAELVLSTGEVVDLEQSTESIIQEGQVALENSKGVLKYKNNEDDKSKSLKTNILKVPRGAEYQLVLPDGTKVWLNSETELTYAVPFTGSERRVALKGEAYFDVTPNNELPFIVASGHQEIQVLGTEFNVSAYADDNAITTTLVEGKVQVTNKLSEGKANLLPNEQTIVYNHSKDIKKQQVDVYPFIAWKEGRFVFNNVTLEAFLSKMSRWYDVEVFFDDDSLKTLSFTGNLPRYSNMTSILKIVEAEMSVHIDIEDNKKIYVHK